MKVEFNYGTSVLTLPSDVRKYIKSAGKNDLAVILALTDGSAENVSSVASVCGITEAEAAASIAFWRGAGIIATSFSVISAIRLNVCGLTADSKCNAISKPSS